MAKKQIEISLNLDAYEKMMDAYAASGCRTKSEFAERAILWYSGYIKSKGDMTYLPEALAEVLRGHLGRMETAVCRYLGKVAVELDINSHINAAKSEIPMEDYYKLRKLAETEVAKNGGNISFGKALNFQRGEDA